MNLFYQPRIAERIFQLEEEESRHCIKVLRKREGEIIRLTDGKGSFYDAVITKADPRVCQFNITDTYTPSPLTFSIHVAIAPTKNIDRIEWFVEKSVELGIDRISLIECDHSERTFIKTERLKKVAISAMKQSLKALLPTIENPISFRSFVEQQHADQNFIAYVDDQNTTQLKDIAKPNNSYLVLIGPEGDFSNDELMFALQNNFVKVGLGKSRLRTETAGIAACHILNLVNG